MTTMTVTNAFSMFDNSFICLSYVPIIVYISFTVRIDEEITFENKIINREGNNIYFNINITENRTKKVLLLTYHIAG